MCIQTFVLMPYTYNMYMYKNKVIKSNMQKMVSRTVKYLLCKTNNFLMCACMRITYLGKILRIQMLIYSTLSSHIFQSQQMGSYKIFLQRNIFTKLLVYWRTLNFFSCVQSPSWSKAREISKNEQAGCQTRVSEIDRRKVNLQEIAKYLCIYRR